MPGDPNSCFHAWAAGAPPTESSFPSSDAHYLNTPPFSLCIESERSENGFSQSVPSSVSIVFPPKFSLSIHRPRRNAVRVAAAGTSALCHRTKRSSCERVATDALLSLQRETDWGQKVRALREDLSAAEPLPRAPPRGFEQGVEPPGAEPLRAGTAVACWSSPRPAPRGSPSSPQTLDCRRHGLYPERERRDHACSRCRL